MIRHTRRFILAIVLVASACNNQQAQHLGDTSAQNLGKASESLKQVAQSLGKGLSKVRQGLDDAELTGKVYVRILWDKDLQESKVSISSKPGGIVTIRGTVPSRTIRRRILELAESTIGVEEVDDQMEVDPDATTRQASRDGEKQR
ncbi:MAG: BON domain-containing protein [Planctomycetota bacterium]